MSARHPQTNRLVHECSRCDTTLNPDGEPVEQNAVYYVEADEERNPFTVHGAVALRHTDRTRQLRDVIASERDLTTTEANNAIARGETSFEVLESAVDIPEGFGEPGPEPAPIPDSIPGSWVTSRTESRTLRPQQDVDYDVRVETVEIPRSEFEREELADPEVAKHDDDVVTVRGERIEVDRPAYLLICADCKREGDRVEWAGAKAPHP